MYMIYTGNLFFKVLKAHGENIEKSWLPPGSCKMEQPGLPYRLFAWGIVSISQKKYKAQEGTNAEQPSLFCFKTGSV